MAISPIYNENNVKKIIVPNLKWRLCSFKFTNDNWISNVRFSTYSQLYRFLLKHQPLDCYQSVSLYNPYNKFKRFKSEMFIDLDTTDIKNLKHCIEELKKINKKPTRLVFSGGGFHIYLDGVRYRKPLLDYLTKKGITLDKRIHDRTRISRMIGTYNYKRKIYASLLHLENWEEEFSILENNDESNLTLEEIGDKDSLPSPFFLRFFTLKNKKSYIFFKRVNDLQKAIKLAKFLQRKHNLGKMYIFGYEKEVAIMSLKSMSKRELKKIKKNYKFYGIIRTSSYFGVDGKRYSVPPKKLITIEGKTFDNYSRFHAYFLKHLGFDINLKTKKPTLFLGRFGGNKKV